MEQNITTAPKPNITIGSLDRDSKPLSFAERTRLKKVQVSVHVELGENNVLIPYRQTDDKAGIRFSYEAFAKCSRETQARIKPEQLTHLTRLELFMAAQVFSQGPKIFRPTSEQLFALEKMKLNIEMRDFYTPFPAIVIEMPHQYSKARCHHSERAINYSCFYFDKKTNLLVHDIVYDEHGLKAYWLPRSDEILLEDWFAACETNKPDGEEPEDGDFIAGDIPLPWAEYKLELLVRRAVCNYCLLLDEVGTKPVGPVHPGEYHQLVKWCEKNNAHTKGNKIKLVAQPIVHTMKAVPTPLVRTVQYGKPMVPYGPSGRVMPYHIRRGHYKMQPFGPREELLLKNEDGTYRNRKRIRIPAVVINAHLAPGVPPTQEYKT